MLVARSSATPHLLTRVRCASRAPAVVETSLSIRAGRAPIGRPTLQIATSFRTSFVVVARLPCWLGDRCNISIAYIAHDTLIETGRKHSHQGHHAHHHGAPVPRQTVVFRLVAAFIHAHVHERILGETRPLVRSRRNGHVMHRLKTDW